MFFVTSTGLIVGVIVGGISTVGEGDGMVGVGEGISGAGVQPNKMKITVSMIAVGWIDLRILGITHSEK